MKSTEQHIILPFSTKVQESKRDVKNSPSKGKGKKKKRKGEMGTLYMILLFTPFPVQATLQEALAQFKISPRQIIATILIV